VAHDPGGPPRRICVVGDLVLDVIARLHAELAPGDDVPADTELHAGGQAANVAAWAAELGATARCIAPLADDDAGRIIRAELAGRGVEVVGPAAERTGVVVSLVGTDRDRSMASDRGAPAGLDPTAIDPAWLAGQDWLHVSGYLLSRAAGAGAAANAAEHARAAGARVSLDASSAALIEQVGADAFRERAAILAPDVLFATEAEIAAMGGEGAWPATLTVVKRGALGCTLHHSDGSADRRLPAVAATPVDATGAGDAFAAGFLVGGPQLALEAGARCVAGVGAMP
jgi:sugar/nucleoside kinase (ribokinase family)